MPEEFLPPPTEGSKKPPLSDSAESILGPESLGPTTPETGGNSKEAVGAVPSVDRQAEQIDNPVISSSSVALSGLRKRFDQFKINRLAKATRKLDRLDKKAEIHRTSAEVILSIGKPSERGKQAVIEYHTTHAATKLGERYRARKVSRAMHGNMRRAVVNRNFELTYGRKVLDNPRSVIRDERLPFIRSRAVKGAARKYGHNQRRLERNIEWIEESARGEDPFSREINLRRKEVLNRIAKYEGRLPKEKPKEPARRNEKPSSITREVTWPQPDHQTEEFAEMVESTRKTSTQNPEIDKVIVGIEPKYRQLFTNVVLVRLRYLADGVVEDTIKSRLGGQPEESLSEPERELITLEARRRFIHSYLKIPPDVENRLLSVLDLLHQTKTPQKSEGGISIPPETETIASSTTSETETSPPSSPTEEQITNEGEPTPPDNEVPPTPEAEESPEQYMNRLVEESGPVGLYTSGNFTAAEKQKINEAMERREKSPRRLEENNVGGWNNYGEQVVDSAENAELLKILRPITEKTFHEEGSEVLGFEKQSDGRTNVIYYYKSRGYKDDTGREIFSEIAFTLPEQLATSLQEKVRENPTIIRDVFRRQCLAIGISVERWRRIQPRYFGEDGPKRYPPDWKLQVVVREKDGSTSQLPPLPFEKSR
jgi:hypothetical protein